jgi:hypothetical protein
MLVNTVNYVSMSNPSYLEKYAMETSIQNEKTLTTTTIYILYSILFYLVRHLDFRKEISQ